MLLRVLFMEVTQKCRSRFMRITRYTCTRRLKKANELMAHIYSHLYNLPTTGLRFFTVYGPWNRSDMALKKFAKAIMTDKPIQLFNYGNHRRGSYQRVR